MSRFNGSSKKPVTLYWGELSKPADQPTPEPVAVKKPVPPKPIQTTKAPWPKPVAKPASAPVKAATPIVRPVMPAPALVVQTAPVPIARIVAPSSRAEVLQTAFNEAVGALLDETRANNGYTVSYQPAEDVDGTVRLKLEVINHRNWGVFSAEIESTKNGSYVMKNGNNTSHIPEALLPQTLSVISHGIRALRITA